LSDFHERERRRSPRLEYLFPATLRGTDAMGQRLDIDTVLDNISANGLYVRISRRLEPGVAIAVGIALKRGQWETTGRVALRGIVTRVELPRRGEYGVAIAFSRYRFY
jgi:hypothetical protein